MNSKPFIACGMYAPNEGVKNAWQALFDRFYPLIDAPAELQTQLLFAADEALLRDPDLYIGHSCGYPLMANLQDALLPVCVPCFDLPGVDGKQYSSCFITPVDSAIESLAQCQGKIVAINNSDSNSGMNLLRYALAKQGASSKYFSNVLLTGGHLASLEAVAANRAQLAAIDSVSFQLIADQNPELVSAVRIIDFSEPTCGLPFVVPRAQYSQPRSDSCVAAFNQALAQLPAGEKNKLHLDHFEGVSLNEYQSILELENFAIEAGYAELN